MEDSVIGLLKRAKRFLEARAAWAKARREAIRAFAYDRSRFMANAGALHLDRKSA